MGDGRAMLMAAALKPPGTLFPQGAATSHVALDSSGVIIEMEPVVSRWKDRRSVRTASSKPILASQMASSRTHDGRYIERYRAAELLGW